MSARGSIRVRATCTSYAGREPALCPTLFARVRAGSFVSPLTQGLSEIDMNVPLPAGPQTVIVVVEWMDSRGVYYHGTDTLTVNVTP